MTALLPPNLLRLFAPRPPLPYLPPVTSDTKKPVIITGLAGINDVYEDDYVPSETALERQKRILQEKKQKHLELQESIKSSYPSKSDLLTQDPYKTLFVGNLDYSITAENLEAAFKVYGDLVSVVIVKNHDGKPKGYGFVQFARSKSLEAAVREAKGLKLGQRRILVDVERGRTVKGWVPKKCGGGLGRKRFGPGPGTSRPRERRDIPRDRDAPRRHSPSRDRRDRDLRADLDRGRGDRGDRAMSRGGDRYPDNRGGGFRDRLASGGNRSDRPERSDRSERSERPERNDRDRNGGRYERGDRGGGYERKRYDR